MQLAVAVLSAALVLGALAVTPRRALRWLLWVSLIGAVGVILWLTLALSFGDAGGTGLNVTPFDEIRRALNSGGSGRLNLVGNIAMFVPVGALVAWILARCRVLIATAVGALFSVAIEVTQLSLGRVGDIDDVILNTTGALLGGLLAVTWARVVRRRWADYDESAGL